MLMEHMRRGAARVDQPRKSRFTAAAATAICFAPYAKALSAVQAVNDRQNDWLIDHLNGALCGAWVEQHARRMTSPTTA